MFRTAQFTTSNQMTAANGSAASFTAQAFPGTVQNNEGSVEALSVFVFYVIPVLRGPV